MTLARISACFAAALAVVLLIACPPHGTPQPVPPGDTGSTGYDPPPPIDAGLADAGAVIAGAAGAACDLDADCDSGVCEGMGCDEGQGICAPATRGCTRDLRQYCGCDGNTFSGSGSCPGQRYASKGACPP